MDSLGVPDYDVEEVTPGHILIRIGPNRIKIYGEALTRISGQPDYIVYRNSIAEWLPPQGGHLSDSEKRLVESVVADWAARKQIAIEIE